MTRHLFLILAVATALSAGAQALPASTFAFDFDVDLPGTPDEMYDALTGDISGWWDHTMSGNPVRLEIQARPGGQFLEVFDGTGDGVVHATVTYAQRGKLLRMEGPLGLAGFALHLVTTYTLTPIDTGCRLNVAVHGAGEVHEGWPALVEKTWRHFIEDRFLAYVQAGRHLD
ncbi:MAG: SRPBCC domain-containing protein [Candidatus Krumholzibacteriia bacterium]